MIEAYLVRYQWGGAPAKFITLDRSRADSYAAQYNGIVYPLVVCETESNNKPSVPSSTTPEAACSHPLATAT